MKVSTVKARRGALRREWLRRRWRRPNESKLDPTPRCGGGGAVRRLRPVSRPAQQCVVFRKGRSLLVWNSPKLSIVGVIKTKHSHKTIMRCFPTRKNRKQKNPTQNFAKLFYFIVSYIIFVFFFVLLNLFFKFPHDEKRAFAHTILGNFANYVG